MDVKTKTQLKQWLPFGAQTTIAKKTGKTQPYISQVMNGIVKNEEILDMLIAMARENKRRLEQIQREFENKVNDI